MRTAYCFLTQDKLDWQDILQPHWVAALVRMREHPMVLCLQDTTQLDIEGKVTRGLRPLNDETRRSAGCTSPPMRSRRVEFRLGVIDV